MSILAIDVYYRAENAKAVGVIFNLEDAKPAEVIIEYIEGVGDYVPGEFYKRELPCIKRIFEVVNLDIVEAIIIDGHMYVDNVGNFGLGGYALQLLKNKVPVIGVAKSSFYANKETVAQVFRGKSKNPLYVSAIGMELNIATDLIKNMRGAYRIPDILKELDRITKED